MPEPVQAGVTSDNTAAAWDALRRLAEAPAAAGFAGRVGAGLRLSPRTIGRHLRKVLTKLAIRSRTYRRRRIS